MCSICLSPKCIPGCPNYEPQLVASCDECWRNLFDDEEYEEVNGRIYCMDCYEALVKETEDEVDE